MCGIVAIAGGLDLRDEATIKNLLVLDYPRGEHSTGFAAIRSSDESAYIAKIASNPIDLFQMQSFKNACHAAVSDVFLGHNRHATRGGISTANAHPFHYDHIVGVHNGTFMLADITPLEKAVGEKFSVDSQLVFAAIAKLGIKETMKYLTEGKDSLTGAWAMVWYNQKTKTLEVLRNKHRPLWYCYTKDFKRLFIASEYEIIKASLILAKSAYDLHLDKEGYGYFPFEEDVHYTFDVDKFKDGGKRPKPKTCIMKGKEAKAVTSYPLWTQENEQEWEKQWADQYGTEKESGTLGFTVGKTNSNQKTECLPTRQKTSTTTRSDKIKLKHFIGSPTSPFAGYITPERWAKFGNNIGEVCCSFCWEPVDYYDPGIVVMDALDKVLCRECAGHPPSEQLPPTRIFVRGSAIEMLR